MIRAPYQQHVSIMVYKK